MTDITIHQSQLAPAENKFHKGNGDDGKHYWLTPPELYAELDLAFDFDFDPCPYPLPEGFDGLTCEWGKSNYVNPPFGSIIHEGKKKGPTAWVRKAIEEYRKGKRVVLVYPVDKWVLMLLKEIFGEFCRVRNLGDVRWLATEDGSAGKGTGRHIACFILEPDDMTDHKAIPAQQQQSNTEAPTTGPSPGLGLPRAPVPEWQQRQFERLIDKLSEWRGEDHEDAITLCRSEIIAILEGVKMCRNVGLASAPASIPPQEAATNELAGKLR